MSEDTKDIEEKVSTMTVSDSSSELEWPMDKVRIVICIWGNHVDFDIISLSHPHGRLTEISTNVVGTLHFILLSRRGEYIWQILLKLSTWHG